MRYFNIDEDNNIVGKLNTSQYDKLIWYKKLYCFFNRNYKNRFVYIEGFNVEIKETISDGCNPLRGFGLSDFDMTMNDNKCDILEVEDNQDGSYVIKYKENE